MRNPKSPLNDIIAPERGDKGFPNDPLQQLPRRRFSVDRNIWLPIVIVVVLAVPIVWLSKVLLIDRHRTQIATNASRTNDATNETERIAEEALLNNTNSLKNVPTNTAINDSDGDGLADQTETAVYGTDPTENDSDGDGFDDGTEVKNGYNPSGPGLLTQAVYGSWSSCANLEAGVSCTSYCLSMNMTCLNKGTPVGLQNFSAEFQNRSGRDTYGSEIVCKDPERYTPGGMTSGGCDDTFSYYQQGVRCFCI